MKTITVQKADGFYVYRNNEYGDLLGVFTTPEDAAHFLKSLLYL